MLTPRMTASLSVALAASLLPGVVLSQSVLQDQMAMPSGFSQTASGTSSTTTIAQTNTNGQSTGIGQSSYTTPGTTLQTPGANLSTPGVTSTNSNVQSGGATQSSPLTTGTTGTTQPGVTQTSVNGQAIGPSLPYSTKTPGAEQTFVNGQSTGTTQVAPPLSTGTTQTPLNGQPVGNPTTTSGSTATQASPGSVLNPPQIIQGSGAIIPTAQPAAGTVPATGVPTQPQPAPTQSVPSSAATGSTMPSASPAASAQGQQGQGSLDTALQQATCAQDWGRAIRLVNTAIASTPTSQTGYRTQLASYRSRLQTLQAKGVRAPNWAQQCRGGSVANVPEQ